MMMLMIYQLNCARDDVNIELLALEEKDNHLTEPMTYLKALTLLKEQQQAST